MPSRREKGRSSAALPVLAQIDIAFRRENLVGVTLSGATTALCPVIAFATKTWGMLPDVAWYLQPQSAVIAGGLFVSASTVWRWMTTAYRSAAKAAAFVVLIVGALLFSNVPAIAYVVLVVIFAMNLVAGTCNLVLDQAGRKDQDRKKSPDRRSSRAKASETPTRLKVASPSRRRPPAQQSLEAVL